MTQSTTGGSPANQVTQIYEETFQQILELARQALNNPTFGADVHELAAMSAIPGLPALLEDELLHFARAVAKRRNAA